MDNKPESPKKEPIRQTINHPCPKCGSRYRRGEYCNVKDCGTYAPVSIEKIPVY